VCASKRRHPEADLLCGRPPFYETLIALGAADAGEGEGAIALAARLPRGVILGLVDLVECYPTHDMPAISAAERSFGDFGAGRFAWQVENARPLPDPIPVRGSLGLFDVPASMLPEEFRQ
jgi:hypothetical protein